MLARDTTYESQKVQGSLLDLFRAQGRREKFQNKRRRPQHASSCSNSIGTGLQCPVTLGQSKHKVSMHWVLIDTVLIRVQPPNIIHTNNMDKM